MKFLLCLLFSHDLEPIETLSPTTTKMFCHRCEKHFGWRVADGEESLFLWTDGMEHSLCLRKTSLRDSRALACKGAR